jgi:hypothetical protein
LRIAVSGGVRHRSADQLFLAPRSWKERRKAARDMPADDDAALADLELLQVDDGRGAFAFFDDRPAFFAPGHAFVQ